MKSKKLTSMLTALFMLALFIPTTFTAAATNYLSVNKTTFTVSEAIQVTVAVSSLTKEQRSSAWVGIYNTGVGVKVDGYGLSHTFINDFRDGQSTQFKAPNTLGEYDVRLCWKENGGINWAEAIKISVVSTQAQPGDLTINKNEFLVSDSVVVTISGLTEGQIKDSAWAGLFKPTDLNTTNPLKRVYVSSFKDGKTWEFPAPKEYGDYEIRVFTKGPSNTNIDATLFGKLTFKVTSYSAKDGDLKISGDRFLVNDKIQITITGITKGQIDDSAWAGMFYSTDKIDANALHRVYITNLRDGKTWEIPAPDKYGKYEIRVFTKNAAAKDLEQALFGKLNFLVGSNQAQPGDLKLDKTTYKQGESAIVTITGLTPGQISEYAWAGIFNPTDELKTPALSRVYINNLRDGKTWTIKVPNKAGAYEVRVFTQNIGPDDLDLAYFGKLTFTVTGQRVIIGDIGAFSWNNYTLKVNPTMQFTVLKNKTYTVKVTAVRKGEAPITANALVKYAIANRTIATVTSTGTVKGIKAGTTTLTISAGTQKIVLKVVVR